MNKYILRLLPALLLIQACESSIENYSVLNKLPKIYPDYTNIVIPPNIAPLNFNIEEPGEKYQVEISADKGNKIILSQTSPSIEVPLEKWHSLLEENPGQNLKIDIYVKKTNWVKYKSIIDSIASEKLENHLVYRLINSANVLWYELGLYQRNLENFEETPIFENRSNNNGCANCHNVCFGDPKKVSFHFRKNNPGTLILDGGKKLMLDTKTKYTMSPFAYPAWHPYGEYIAYVVNLVHQDFTTDTYHHEFVFDEASDLVLYNIKTNIVTTTPKIASQRRENMPVFSKDGKYLYFISAPKAGKSDSSKMFVKFDLLKIGFDDKTCSWGDVDTVLKSDKLGKSITFPRISPDGKYLIFTATDYGYFSIYNKHSDLYLLNLETNEVKPLEINSPYTESYHTWSQTGRWFVFSSKQIDGTFTRPFFSYFDKNGKSHKAFPLPQKNPEFYKTFLKNYNIPELANGKIDIDAIEVRDFIQTEPKKVKFDTLVDLDALSGATWLKKEAERKRQKPN